MLTHDRGRFQTNRAIAQRRALGTTGYDSKLLAQGVLAPTSPLI